MGDKSLPASLLLGMKRLWLQTLPQPAPLPECTLADQSGSARWFWIIPWGRGCEFRRRPWTRCFLEWTREVDGHWEGVGLYCTEQDKVMSRDSGAALNHKLMGEVSRESHREGNCKKWTHGSLEPAVNLIREERGRRWSSRWFLKVSQRTRTAIGMFLE